MEILFEIGTEEIPALFVKRALTDIKEIARDMLTTNRVGFEAIETYGTPRRLVLHVTGVEERQKDEVRRIMGPPRAVAFDEGGRPTPAASGFARKQGVSVDALKVVATERGEYVCVEKEIKGRDVRKLLPEVLPEVIKRLSFPKTMRWGNSDITFARPIHWILAIADGEILPFEYGGIRSGDLTRGHPFLAPGPFPVHSFEEYREVLRKASVVFDQRERERIIREGIERAASEVGGKVYRDEDLVEEVTYLVENPVVLRGSFPEEFLDLPKEVLIHAMRSHQRYFSIIDERGELLPFFITVANTEGRDRRIIIKGNERVLKARLEDARFYFEEDRKVPLEKRVEELKGVVFHSRLGTSYEKMLRFRELARMMAKALCPEKEAIVDRVAYLCKADLVTEMVGEFPELQGVMGREYALLNGEDREVAQAIYEHYLPTTSGDRVPETEAGAIVSIADKLDTILGCFSVGIQPTGAADPYGLRRQAIGVINIIVEKGWRLPLKELIEEGLRLLKEKRTRDEEEVKREVEEFFKARLYNQLISSGYPHDVIDAVLSSGWDDIVDAVNRVKALSSFKGTPDYKPLGLTIKRILNITRGFTPGKVDPSLFEEEMERELYQAYLDIKERVTPLLEDGRYREVLEELLHFKGPVDRFFDHVMVMVEDEAVRSNRLTLLSMVGGLFNRIGDFSKLVIE